MIANVWEGTPKGTNPPFVMFFNKSLLFMIKKNLDSHVPHNYYLLQHHMDGFPMNIA
jgi:hypothetical protein